MASVAQELNKYYCKESGRCMKTDTCDKSLKPDIEELHKKKGCKVKFTYNTPSCFKER